MGRGEEQTAEINVRLIWFHLESKSASGGEAEVEGMIVMLYEYEVTAGE